MKRQKYQAPPSWSDVIKDGKKIGRWAIIGGMLTVENNRGIQTTTNPSAVGANEALSRLILSEKNMAEV